MIVKVGRYGGSRHIVGRVLHRSKGINLLSQRKHDNASGMLACGTAHAYAALDDPVDLTVALSGSPFLIIFFYIAKGRLICQSTDGTCPEGLTFSKNNLCVIMSLTLVLTGKV